LHKQLYIKYYLKEKIEDIFGKKTYAESQRDKYKKVVRNLEKELKKTDNLSDVMAQLATDYNIMEMNSDSAQGKLSDTFVTKESENCEAVEKLGADFKEIIAEVKLKLEFARKAEIFMAGWSFFDSELNWNPSFQFASLSSDLANRLHK
jgi:type I restriction-modification system DNA methylase subunit